MDSSEHSGGLADLQFAMEVVNLALNDERHSFDMALQRIAEEFQAFGCIVWEKFDPDERDRSADEPKLYMLAAWFPPGKFLSMCDLPIEGTISGNALKNRRPERCKDVKIEGGPRKDHPFLAENKIAPLLSVPITFHDGKLGTFDLLRTDDKPIFTHEEIQRAEVVARQLPKLYQACCDRLTLKVVQHVNHRMETIHWTKDPAVLKRSIRGCLDEVCLAIADELQALEVTVVLNDSISSTGAFKVRSTTWTGTRSDLNMNYVVDEHEKFVIEHKTEWVIRNRKSIVLFDLNQAEATEAQKRYEKLHLHKNDDFNAEAKEKIQESIRKRLLDLVSSPEDVANLTANINKLEPPISYIAVPILYEDHVLGALRCCATTYTPAYFSEREALLLSLLASKIGQFWATFIQITEQRDQLEATKRVVDGIGKAVAVVQKHIETERPTFESIIDKVLEITANALPLAQQIEFHKQGAYHRTVEHRTPDVAARSGIASESNQTRSYPCEVSEDVRGSAHIGRLLVRGEVGVRADHFLQYLQLFAAQFGLFQVLIDQIGKQRKLRDDVNERYQEITHQLQLPLIQARDRATRIASMIKNGKQSRIKDVEYYALRGLCQKALVVMRILKVDTEGSEQLVLRPRPIIFSRGADALTTLLEEAAFDFELQHVRSGTKFYISRGLIYEALTNRPMAFDRDLFQQVVYCIFENAMKYSEPGSTIMVTVSRTNPRELCIEVANQGITLSKEDAANCMKRGWRAEQAIQVTDAGKGLGLWLSSEIMRNLAGQLQVFPTDATKYTRVKIFLPL